MFACLCSSVRLSPSSDHPVTHSLKAHASSLPPLIQEVLKFWWTVNKLLYTRPWRDALNEIRVRRVHLEPRS